MNWSTTNVSKGGILHPAKASYSPETHQLLRVLMEESKMTMLQRKQVNYFLRNGEPLPPPAPRSRSCNELTPTKKLPTVTIRPASSRRRTREAIQKSGAYERERFFSKEPKVDREKEKSRLQNRMAFGRATEPKPKRVLRKHNSLDVEPNRFDQLVQEIQEREEWLQQMEELGEGKKHKLIIQQQIQARVREMQKLKLEDHTEL